MVGTELVIKTASSLSGLRLSLLFPPNQCDALMSRQRVPQLVDADRRLTVKQKRIVDHIMTTGETPYAAAEALGTQPSNIYRTLRLPHVRKYLHELTLQHIGIVAPYAAKVQESLLQANSESVRAAVAENILDRHLGKPVQRSQVALQGSINVTIDLG